MNWYWGDLHCHTNLSYGRGTMERAFEIARTHLDFCSVTGHAFWPDMPEDLREYDGAITMHLGGFAKCRKYWKKYLALTEQCNDEDLVTFPSYEWHSDLYGDYNVYAKSSPLELLEVKNVREFEKYLDAEDCVIAPHHIGYTGNNRGLDWRVFEESKCKAFVEVYSNHGCAMSDSAPFDYYHTMGPRDSKRTVDYGLKQGCKFGFIGSTDSHDGFPGHYSHGRVGVLSDGKTRELIWDAMINRRTVAVTGAKIKVNFTLNEADIGSEIESKGGKLDIVYSLQGNQPFRLVELNQAGSIAFRHNNEPIDQDDPGGIYYVKLEWGWGRKEQVYTWDNTLKIIEGELLSVEPCFRHSCLELTGEASHKILDINTNSVTWTSKTRGVPDSVVHNPQTMTSGVNALVLKIKAAEKTSILLETNLFDISADMAHLRAGGVVRHAGGHESPAVRINRAYSQKSCCCNGRLVVEPKGEHEFYYIWGQQIDNESIWATPIWVRNR